MRSNPWAITLILALSGASLCGAQEAQIGVFDQAMVFERTEEGGRMREELAALRDRKQKEIAEKEDQLQALRDKFGAEEFNLTKERRNELERQIDQELRNYQRLNEDATREVKTQLSEYQDRFQRETYKVVEILGKELGYTLILEKSLLFYHSESIDITDEVIRKFNEMHKTSP